MGNGITYSKLGDLYRVWSKIAEKQTTDKQSIIALKEKLIESCTKALKYKPSHIQYTKVQNAIAQAEMGLKLLRADDDATPALVHDESSEQLFSSTSSFSDEDERGLVGDGSSTEGE